MWRRKKLSREELEELAIEFAKEYTLSYIKSRPDKNFAPEADAKNFFQKYDEYLEAFISQNDSREEGGIGFK